jgi:hypothetical protein
MEAEREIEVEKRYLLVTHQSPDFDAISAVFTWLLAKGKKVSDSDISFGFVWPGKRWTKLCENTIVVHFDTGNIYNPKTNDFDHHQDRDRWPSAARTVFEAYPHLHEDALLREMIEFTDKVDSGSQISTEDQAEKDFRRALNSNLREFNFKRPQQIVIINEQSGPRETIDLIANMEAEIGDIDDNDKMLTGIIALERWYNDNKQPVKLAFSMKIKDRHLFDKVCALFLKLMAGDKWLYDLGPNELQEMIDTLPDEPRKLQSQAVFDLYQPLWSNPIFRSVTELARLVVLRGVVLDESEESKKLLQELRDKLAETSLTRKNKLIPIILNRGPWGVAYQFPDDSFPEQARIILGLIMMKAWYNRRTLSYRIQPLVEEARWEEKNGLTFVLTGDTSIAAKNIRSEIRRRYRDQIHVFTTLYVDKRTGVKSIGVTRVQKNLNGMAELANRLREIDPTADVFLFQPSNFVIYVKYDDVIDLRKPNREILLTPERIHQEAMAILHPIDDDETPDWDGSESTETVEVEE